MTSPDVPLPATGDTDWRDDWGAEQEEASDRVRAELSSKVTAVTPGLKLWKGTQAAYDAIASKDTSTIYVVQG